ncbi:MAG TPA: hypothetical protein VJ924_03930 [Alphaproteobacteria bacterium]|nr:hypothetical protein [Alphaproteobacteria bacterium]
MLTRTLGRPVAAALIAAATLGAPAADLRAQQGPVPRDEAPAEQAREAIEKLLRALSQAIANLPQYEMPTMNERGDIIIRRKNPPATKTPEPPPEGGTRT